MIQQEPQSVSFLQQNLLLISIVVLAIFGYLVLIIRKRWKKNFLHEKPPKGTK
jgi:hypothetical protein